MNVDTLVLPEAEHIRGKNTDKQTSSSKPSKTSLPGRFKRHNIKSGCCNIVELEIELEELVVPLRKGEEKDPTQNKCIKKKNCFSSTI